MRFAQVIVLWIGAGVVLLLAGFLAWSWRRKQALLTQFVDRPLLVQMLRGLDPVWQKWRLVVIVAASLFLWLTLARPQWGYAWEEATQRGRDILVAIDTSRSMLASDLAPNRLARAKLAALDLMRLAKHDRLGLIAFAGSAFVQCPLTLDEEAFRQSVGILDTGIIPQGGTALSEAIDSALSTFKNDSADNHKVLVIFTDGEDHEEGAKETAARAAKAGLRIFTVGVGTPGGELLRVKDEQGRDSFVKDDQGNVVKSALNESLLRDIATTANGFYLSLRDNKAMEVLYEQGLSPLPTSEISSKMVKRLHERYRWPLVLAIIALIAEVFWPESGFRKRLLPTAATAALLFFVLGSSSAQASASRAQKDFERGEYRRAQEEYDRLLARQPEDARLQYNSGRSAYAAGDYAKSAQRFESALAAKDARLQQHAYYNLGNSEYKLGETEADPTQKQQRWEKSLQHFERAVGLDAKDEDARHNLELVRKQLEELKKQQQQKKPSDDKKSDDQKKDQDNKDSQENKKQDQSKDNKDKDQEPKDSQDEKNDGGKKGQEEQKDSQQNKSNAPDKQPQPQEKDPSEQKQASNGQPDKEKNPDHSADQKQRAQEEANADAQAAQLGQMTPKQARQMLEAQKGEEKAMIFLPAKDPKKSSRNHIFKDW